MCVWRSKTEATTKTNESRKRQHTKIEGEREKTRHETERRRKEWKKPHVIPYGHLIGKKIGLAYKRETVLTVFDRLSLDS